MNKIIGTFLLFSISICITSQNQKYDTTVNNNLIKWNQFSLVKDTIEEFSKINIEIKSIIDLKQNPVEIAYSKVIRPYVIIKDEKAIQKLRDKAKKQAQDKADALAAEKASKNKEEKKEKKKKNFFKEAGKLGGQFLDAMLEEPSSSQTSELTSEYTPYEYTPYNGGEEMVREEIFDKILNGRYKIDHNNYVKKSEFLITPQLIEDNKINNPDRLGYECIIKDGKKSSEGYVIIFPTIKNIIIVKKSEINEEIKSKNKAELAQKIKAEKKEYYSKRINEWSPEWTKIFPDSCFQVYYIPWKITEIDNIPLDKFSKNLVYGEYIISNDSSKLFSKYENNDTIISNTYGAYNVVSKKPIFIKKYNIINALDEENILLNQGFMLEFIESGEIRAYDKGYGDAKDSILFYTVFNHVKFLNQKLKKSPSYLGKLT